MRPITLISLMCLGIILTLMCYANFPALQPQFEALWGLTKLESGLIFGIFFGGVLAGYPNPFAAGRQFRSAPDLAVFSCPDGIECFWLRLSGKRVLVGAAVSRAYRPWPLRRLYAGFENSQRSAGRSHPDPCYRCLHSKLHYRLFHLLRHDR